jgi:TRAP-type uncharacterized transport system substrate-binding protein
MEAENILSSEALTKFQQKAWFRKTVASVLIVVILALTGYFAYGFIPKNYTLRITGGDILGNRHLIAKILKDEAASYGVNLIIEPTEGSIEAVKRVSEGKLDLALVQSGLEDKPANVHHVATLPAEVTHFLVKPSISEIEDLKGKIINTGSKSDGTRVTTKQVLDFSNLDAGVDYIETNYNFEQLVKMKDDKLPDAIVNISYSPSFVADFFVKERGYKVMELPFPPSLALRYGWVGEGAKILAFTYNTLPPVPAKDIVAVGVNLQLIANSEVNPKAISKLLEALYSPTVVNRINQKVDEASITTAASYPISPGTKAYLSRNDSFFSQETMEQLKNLLGLLFTVGSSSMIMMKWLKGGRLDDDDEIKEYITLVSNIEKEIGAMEQRGAFDLGELTQLSFKLTSLKSDALEKYNKIKLKDPALMDTFLASVTDTRNYVTILMDRAKMI